MDLLKTLEQKREVNRRRQHPLSSLSLEERSLYMFGLAVLAKGNMKTIRELSAPYEKIGRMLSLTQEECDATIVDINDHFDETLNQFVQFILVERRRTQCFLIDLCKLSRYADWGSWFAKDVIQQFCYLLHISEQTKHFFLEFLEESDNGDSLKAHQMLSEYEKSGNRIDFELLHYMNSEFRQQQQHDELILNKGGCFRIENSTQVAGDIIVTGGTRLIVSNAELTVGGSIRIENGRAEFYNSVLEAGGEDRLGQYLIEASRQHELKLEDCTLILNFHCAALNQMDGECEILRSTVERSAGAYAIQFGGSYVELSETIFRDCLDGAVKVAVQSQMELFRCQFYNCRASQGGALSASTREPVHIRECSFVRCYAKYQGAAIYFPYQRYAQQVLGCRYEACEPVDSVVFNAYEERYQPVI